MGKAITMKKQGYNSRLDDSLGARNGKKGQSLKSRRDESKGASKAAGGRAYGGNKSVGYENNNLIVRKHTLK